MRGGVWSVYSWSMDLLSYVPLHVHNHQYYTTCTHLYTLLRLHQASGGMLQQMHEYILWEGGTGTPQVVSRRLHDNIHHGDMDTTQHQVHVVVLHTPRSQHHTQQQYISTVWYCYYYKRGTAPISYRSYTQKVYVLSRGVHALHVIDRGYHLWCVLLRSEVPAMV